MLISVSTGDRLETHVVLAVGPGAPQQQHLGALSVAVLTGEVESCVSCLEAESHHLLLFTRIYFLTQVAAGFLQRS